MFKRHLPYKKRFVWRNNSPFKGKKLSKQLWQEQGCEIGNLKIETTTEKSYVTQRSLFVDLLRRVKEDY